MHTVAHVYEADGQTPSADVDLSITTLLLDVDGTLLDIAPTPNAVVVPAALKRILGDLMDEASGAVALVSGRTIETLDNLFRPLVVPAIGGHGAEMRLTSGAPINRTSTAVLPESLRKKLHQLTEIDPRVFLEDKSHSAALHYRLAPEHEPFLQHAVSAIVDKEPADTVEYMFGKHVIDIKPKAFNKGLAVTELMKHKPFAGRTPIFVGDDTTDESVFAILPGLNGIGYSVGRSLAGTHGTFGTSQDVRTWLTEMWHFNRSNA
jgi:trehalose 6-phosphate phosphatase